MNYQLDVVALASLVSTKRADRALSDMAAEIGWVSGSWLSRIEHRQALSLATLLHLCNWLEYPQRNSSTMRNTRCLRPPVKPYFRT